MPFRYPDTVRTEILARVAAGEAVKHICRDAGMPCAESVMLWARRDPSFAVRMAVARAVGDGRRRGAVDPTRAGEIVARLGGGESIYDIVRGPGMPSYRTYMRWRRDDPAFGAAVEAVLQGRIAGARAKLRARYRAFDPAVAERLYLRVFKGGRLRDILRSERAFPSLAVLTRWRSEQPEFDAQLTWALDAWRERRGRERLLCTPELTQRIVDGLVLGESLRSLSRRADMPSQRTLYNWVRDRPDFAAEVAQACRDREHWYMDRMQMALDHIRDPISEKVVRRRITHLRKQLTRLRKRPGWKRARAAAADVWTHAEGPPKAPEKG